MKCIYQAVLTPDEDGYSVTVPDLPGCFTYGDTVEDALSMAADAMSTYVAALLADGKQPPAFTQHDCPKDARSIDVFFETDEDYIIDGDVVSASRASEELGVSKGRVTQMLDAGILEGFRRGRRTYITVNSINARLEEAPKAGRPKKVITPSA